MVQVRELAPQNGGQVEKIQVRNRRGQTHRAFDTDLVGGHLVL